MKTVGKLVGGLSNLQSVMPMLTNLGRTHKMLGIQPAWFDAMRECLCEALAEKLGPTKWTHEVRAPPPSRKPRIRVPYMRSMCVNALYLQPFLSPRNSLRPSRRRARRGRPPFASSARSSSTATQPREGTLPSGYR